MALTIHDLQPVEDRILIIPDEPETVTSGGILLPQGSAEKPCRGTVLAVGPGKPCEATGIRLPMPVEVGEGVYYSKYGGSVLKLAGEPEVVALRPSEIIASFEPDGEDGE